MHKHLYSYYCNNYLVTIAAALHHICKQLNSAVSECDFRHFQFLITHRWCHLICHM